MNVGVDAHSDGGGQVRVSALLDREAAAAVGDVRTQLKVDDLRRAGWTIETPDVRSDGSVEVSVRHPFERPEQVAALMKEVSGATGPFQRFALVERRSFWRTNTHFSGVVDLNRGLESFSDPTLTAALGGQPLGAPVADLERQLGTSLARVFGLHVAARLAGLVDANAPTQTENGAVWAPKLGERVVLDARATSWNIRNIALLVLALITAGALVALVVRTGAAQWRRIVHYRR